MELTKIQQIAFDLAKKNDFIPADESNEIFRRFVSEGNKSTFNYVFENFMENVCPNCGAKGLFKFHTFGNLKHSKCSCSWYISPGQYTSIQLKKSFRAGMDFGGHTMGSAVEDEKKGKKSSTFLGPLFAFIIGTIFRLIFAIISIPIQIIIYFINRKTIPALTEGN